MGFSRQEYWSGLPFSSPGDLPNPGIKSGSLALQADSLSSEPSGKPNITKRSQKLSIPLHSAMLTFFHFYLCLCVLSCFSHVQICDLMDCSPPASSTLQARNRGSGLPCPPPGDPPDPRIKLTSLTSPALAGGFFTTSATRETLTALYKVVKNSLELNHNCTLLSTHHP